MSDPRTHALMRFGGFASMVIVLIATAVATGSGRRYLDEPVAIEATTASQAYEELRASGARGRVLVVLDTTSHVRGSTLLFDVMRQGDGSELSVPVTWESLVEALLESGVARTAYVVVPPTEWTGLSQRLATSPLTLQDRTGYVKRLDGAPVRYTDASRFVFPRERVIVLRAAPAPSGYDPGFLQRITSAEQADIVATFPAGDAR